MSVLPVAAASSDFELIDSSINQQPALMKQVSGKGRENVYSVMAHLECFRKKKSEQMNSLIDTSEENQNHMLTWLS